MTIVLNYLPWVVLFGGIWWSVKPKKGKEFDIKDASMLKLLVTFLVFLALVFSGPSYLPKGTVPELKNPGFEQVEREVENRLRGPNMTEEERQDRFNKIFDAVEQSKQ